MTVTQRRSPTPAKVTAPIPVQLPDSPAADPPEAVETPDTEARNAPPTAETTAIDAAGAADTTSDDDTGDATDPVVDDTAPLTGDAPAAELRASVETAGPRPARYGIQMPRRRPGLVWLAQTVTLGVGHIRWLRRVSRELADLDERAAVNPRRTTLAIVPGVLLIVPACVAWYRLGRRIARAQYAAGLLPTCRPGRGVLLAFALGAVTPYYQRELNKIIDWYGFPTDAPVPLYD